MRLGGVAARRALVTSLLLSTIVVPPAHGATGVVAAAPRTGPDAEASLVHFGNSGDMPSLARFADGLPQDTPFDGVVVRAATGANLLEPSPIDRSALVADLADARRSRSTRGRYGEVFLRAWTLNPEVGAIDWADPTVVRGAVARTSVLAAIVTAGGMRGLFVDTEAYDGHEAWSVPDRVQSPMAVFDYLADVRDAGREIGEVLAARRVTVVLTIGTSGSLWFGGEYTALQSWVQGLRSGGATVVDGAMICYWCNRSEYRETARTLRARGEAVALPVYQEAWRPGRVHRAIRTALRHSDRWAWWYGGSRGAVWDGSIDATELAGIDRGTRPADRPRRLGT